MPVTLILRPYEGRPPGRGGVTHDESVLASAGRYALRLAAATGDARWAEYELELYTALKRPMPQDSVDELYPLVLKLPGFRVEVLEQHLTTMAKISGSASPTDRSAIQLLEGLLTLVSK